METLLPKYTGELVLRYCSTLCILLCCSCVCILLFVSILRHLDHNSHTYIPSCTCAYIHVYCAFITVQGLIFVVDSNDRERMTEARDELSNMVSVHCAYASTKGYVRK